MTHQSVIVPGLNIQAPWADALISGHKVIETRYYPLPQKWIGQPLAIIETPGPARRFKRRIAGLVIFEVSWCYADQTAFARDGAKHLVDPHDRRFGWQGNERPKWAWPVRWVEAYRQALPADFRAGIRYARAVEILRPSLALLYRVALEKNCWNLQTRKRHERRPDRGRNSSRATENSSGMQRRSRSAPRPIAGS
jgi:hypothetical protein